MLRQHGKLYHKNTMFFMDFTYGCPPVIFDISLTYSFYLIYIHYTLCIYLLYTFIALPISQKCKLNYNSFLKKLMNGLLNIKNVSYK